jgi:hypothetical protein
MAVAPKQAVDHAVAHVEKAVAKASPWMEWAARLGYAAKGMVYALIGVLAALAAANVNVGQRDNEMSQKGVINFLARQWYGTALLIAIAVGLAGYALWRLISATLNAEDKGPMKRIGYAITGIAYGYLGYLAVKAVFGARPNPDDKSVARNLIDKPFGQILLIAVGAIVIGIGVAQLWNAIVANFLSVFKLNEMNPWQRTAATVTGRVGLSARAILFGLIGGFFIAAGLHHNVSEAGGISDALRSLQHSIAGNWLLGADCVGLVCYGGFMFFEARFRKIKMTDEQPA